MDENIIVSIICLAYNHEKYIAKMLDSLVGQRTKYIYEIIIHDDASTDGTAEIIKYYSRKYSNIIPILQKENQYSKGVKIEDNFIFPKVRGKYIAYCEGDDYWYDTEKIEKQVEILEKTNCVAVISRVNIMNEDGSWTGDYFPRYKKLDTGVITGDEFVSYVLDTRTINLQQFQLSSLMMSSSIYKSYIRNKPEYSKHSLVGDFPLFLYIGTQGSIYYLNEVLSCYRFGTIAGWNTRNSTLEKKLAHYERESTVVKMFNAETHGRYKNDVDTAISRREFLKYKCAHNIKEMKKNSLNYRLLSRQDRIIEHCLYYAPGLGKTLNRLRILYRSFRRRFLKWEMRM